MDKIVKVDLGKDSYNISIGNSFVDAVYFNFDSGAGSEVSCVNFEETFT